MDELLMVLADEMYSFAQALEARAMELENGNDISMVLIARSVRDVSVQVGEKATEIENLVKLSA